MPTYPPTSDEVKQAISKFPYMVNRPSLDPDIIRALYKAQGDMALKCPQAAEGSLDPALVLSAWAICLDLAVYYIRFDVERNPDSGAPPGALIDWRNQIDDRLKDLKEAATVQDGLYLVEAFCALPPVPFPSRL